MATYSTEYSTDTFPRLQELCLLSLINYTTHYTPEYIALLPTTLRRRFSQLLPAVYLHNTPFLSDLEENELWFDLHSNFDYWTQYLVEGRNQPGYGKESFLNKVIEETLNFPSHTTNSSKCTNTKHIGGVIDSLLCIPKSNEWIFSKPYNERILSTYNLRVICKECKRICPSQLVSSFPNSFVNRHDQLTDVCNILMNVFDRYATSVSHYYQSDTIFNVALSNSSVARFMSKVEELRLNCYSQFESYDRDPYQNRRQRYTHTEAIRIILQSPSSKFSSLLLDKSDMTINVSGYCGLPDCVPRSSLISELKQIAPFFAPVSPVEVEGPSEGFTPYSKLQSLTINGIDIDNVKEVSILMSIMKCQESLRVFDMTCSTKSNLSSLLFSVIHLMKRSGTDFEKLALKGTRDVSHYTIFVETFTSVLVDFLTTIPPPLSSNKDRQILELRFLTVVNNSFSSSSIKKLSHNKKEDRHQQVIDCPGKVLHFEDIHFTSQAMMEFLSILSSYHLEEITICATRSNYRDLCFWQEVKIFTANKISLELGEGFVAGEGTVPDYPLIGNVLKEWVSCERIQVLELVYVILILSPSHLLSLTDALSKSSLTHLVLNECLLGWVPSAANTIGSPVSVLSVIEEEYAQQGIGTEFCGELVLLLTSIVSFLLKTDQFELTLQDDSLNYKHLLLLHYIWSSVCKETRTPFKLLNLKMCLAIPKSLKEQFLSKMNEMALEFRTEFLKLL